MTATRNWTLVGDVGAWAGYHVGDEAMLEANVHLLRELDPGAHLTVVSGDPVFTGESLGVSAVARLGFDRCTTDEERESLLASLSEDPAGSLPPAFERLASSTDGLVISGAGNLTSPWPNYIYERLAFCRRAVRVSAKIIVLGQTIGPVLEPRHREMVSEILRLASWVGVREEHSFALAMELGAPARRLSYQIDDASNLGFESNGTKIELLPFPASEPWIALTFHPMVDPTKDDPLWNGLAEQLAQVASATGCRLVFIPHAKAVPALGAPWSDEDAARALAARLPQEVFHVLPVLTAREVAVLTGKARMVISSRYHPLVFGLAAGVPCLAVWTDEYTRVKLRGALSHYGRADDLLSLDELGTGGLVQAAADLWNVSGSIRSELAVESAKHAFEEKARRSQLRAVLDDSAEPAIEQPRRLIGGLAFIQRESEHARLRAQEHAEVLGRGMAQLSASLNDATEYAKALEGARAGAENYAQSLEERLSNQEVKEVNMDNTIKALAETISNLEKQLQESRTVRLDLDDLTIENRRLRASCGQLQQELLQMGRSAQDLAAIPVNADAQLAKAAAHAKGIEESLAVSAAKAVDLEHRLAISSANAATLEHRLAATYASRSWRITKPLRWLMDLTRG